MRADGRGRAVSPAVGDALRRRIEALMECPECGHRRMSLRQIASRAGVATTALFSFLRGDTNGVVMVARLNRWLDSERPFGYNSRGGSSAQSNSIAPDTRSSATTRGAGVAASIGVVDR